jgi:predicted DNA-binding transcriptional regulator AlpA
MEVMVAIKFKSSDRPGRTPGVGNEKIAEAVAMAMASAKKANAAEQAKIINIRLVCERTSLSKGQIDRLVARGCFPKPIGLSEKRRGWVDVEVSEWIAEKMRGRESGPN